MLFSRDVPTVDKLCIVGIRNDREKYVNQQSAVRFRSEAETGAVIFSTTTSAEQMNMYDVSMLFRSHGHEQSNRGPTAHLQ